MNELMKKSSESYSEICKLADMLKSAGDLIPKRYRNNPGAIAAAIFTGIEIGFSIMASLRSIDIVDGNVQIKYPATVGLLRNNGYRIDWIISNEEKAELKITHKDGSNIQLTYTIEDARIADLLGKSNWIKHPKTMLRARAITSAARSFAGEIFCGFYCPDEIEEIGENRNIIDVEIGEELSGEERLMKTIEATNQESSEEAPELCAPEEEVIQFNTDVRSEVFIELNARIKDAKDQRELAMCVVPIKTSANLSEEEKDELRDTFSNKKQSLG